MPTLRFHWDEISRPVLASGERPETRGQDVRIPVLEQLMRRLEELGRSEESQKVYYHLSELKRREALARSDVSLQTWLRLPGRRGGMKPARDGAPGPVTPQPRGVRSPPRGGRGPGSRVGAVRRRRATATPVGGPDPVALCRDPPRRRAAAPPPVSAAGPAGAPPRTAPRGSSGPGRRGCRMPGGRGASGSRARGAAPTLERWPCHTPPDRYQARLQAMPRDDRRWDPGSLSRHPPVPRPAVEALGRAWRPPQGAHRTQL
jgi:hypothetical protein